MSRSVIEREVVGGLEAEEADAWIDALEPAEVLALERDWKLWGRPEQLPPEGKWRGWMLMAGRGSGKTRAGVEWVISDLQPDDRIALVAPTRSDVRDVVVEGESGILACSPAWNMPTWEPSKRRLTWPNGAIATTYSADKPDRLRGPQHTKAWGDEVAAWRYGPETWSNLMFGLRLGDDPQWVATTTPRPVRLVREILALENVRLSKMTTYENAANLAPGFLDEIISKYEGTRLGRQELLAELLDDIPGALWSRDQLESLRLRPPAPVEMVRIVVAVDPAVTSGEDADETGIVVCGLGEDGLGYVLDDRTCRVSPEAWARVVVEAYEDWQADRVIAEVNNGGDLVETVLRAVNAGVSYKDVHASRGKRVRAEPVAALFEQSRVKLCGSFPDLEDQMCAYVPDAVEESPDRVDALVWGFTELMVDNRRSRIAVVGAGT